MSSLIYLAGPIDEVEQWEAREWREGMAGEAGAFNAVFFSPAHAYVNVTPENFPAVDRMNRCVIRQSDGVLALLLRETVGFGTIREIEFARSCGKPVMVVSEQEPVSLMAYDVMYEEPPGHGLWRLLEAIKEREAP